MHYIANIYSLFFKASDFSFGNVNICCKYYLIAIKILSVCF